LLHLFLPNKHVESIFEIDPQFLQSINKKGVLVDLDNTLVPWDVAHAPENVLAWLKEMEEANIKVTIFSNNNKDRVSLFADPIKTPYIFRAKKPLSRAFRVVQKEMGLSADDMVVIGDQLLTDILGGNRAKVYTILVVPIVQSDAWITKFNRRLERLILNYFYRKGKLTRRDAQE